MLKPGALKRSLRALGNAANRRPLVAIDVDLTFVDSYTPYLEWFEAKSGVPFPIDEHRDRYDLNPVFEQYGVSGHEFWKQADLYDRMVPHPGAVEALGELQEVADLVFVSKCYPEHTNSKIAMLQRCVPYEHAFIATGAKWLVDYDLLIDDCKDIMAKAVKYRPESLHLMYTTPMNAAFDVAAHGMLRLDNWGSLIN